MPESPIHTSGDEVHVHAHKTGHGWVDLAIAISAITISVISLFVAVEHGKTEEKLVAANSWPFLVYQSSSNGLEVGSRRLDLRLSNSGVGPARVEWVKLKLDGGPVRTRADLMTRCCGVPRADAMEQVKAGLVSQNDVVGVLPAREGVTFLAWRETPGNRATWDSLNDTRRRLTFQACYCSVLDECWVSDLKPTARPKRVGQCEPSSEGYEG